MDRVVLPIETGAETAPVLAVTLTVPDTLWLANAVVKSTVPPVLAAPVTTRKPELL